MTCQTFRNNINSLLHSVCQSALLLQPLFSLFYNLQYLWGETIPSIRFKFVACHIRTVCIVEDDVSFKHKLRFVLQTGLRSPKESNEIVTNSGYTFEYLLIPFKILNENLFFCHINYVFFNDYLVSGPTLTSFIRKKHSISETETTGVHM